MSALSHQREVGGPINYIIQFLLDNSSVIRIFLNLLTQLFIQTDN